MKKEHMQVLIDEDLKRRFKAACVMTGTSMSDVTAALIEVWLNDVQKTLDQKPKSTRKKRKSEESADRAELK